MASRARRAATGHRQADQSGLALRRAVSSAVRLALSRGGNCRQRDPGPRRNLAGALSDQPFLERQQRETRTGDWLQTPPGPPQGFAWILHRTRSLGRVLLTAATAPIRMFLPTPACGPAAGAPRLSHKRPYWDIHLSGVGPPSQLRILRRLDRVGSPARSSRRTSGRLRRTTAATASPGRRRRAKLSCSG